MQWILDWGTRQTSTRPLNRTKSDGWTGHFSGKKQEHKAKLFHVKGGGSRSLACPSKPEEKQTFWREIPLKWPGYPGTVARKVCEKIRGKRRT